jgi:hypothetical protein
MVVAAQSMDLPIAEADAAAAQSLLVAEADVQSLQEAQSVEKLLTFVRLRYFREAGEVKTDDGKRVPNIL